MYIYTAALEAETIAATCMGVCRKEFRASILALI